MVSNGGPSTWEAIQFIGSLVGVGGIATIFAAYFGRRAGPPKDMPAPPPPPVVPIQIETPWLVQNILEIKMNTEGTNRSLDALTQQIAQLAMQVNTAASMKAADLQSQNKHNNKRRPNPSD